MIFLDMDGVLCDFITPAFHANGENYDPAKWPKGEFDAAKVLGITAREFWRNIDSAGESFWSELKPYPWTRDLITELQRIDDVVISTSPSRSPWSYSGKRQWLDSEGYGDIPCMFGNKKFLLAKRNRTLIDDGMHNIREWLVAGGMAVVFPQPWNDAEPVDDVVKYVIEALVF